MPGRPAPSEWRRRDTSWYSGRDGEVHSGSCHTPLHKPSEKRPDPEPLTDAEAAKAAQDIWLHHNLIQHDSPISWAEVLGYAELAAAATLAGDTDA